MSCYFRIPGFILYKEGKESHLENAIQKKTNCNKKKTNDILNTLISVNGKIPTKYLKNLFQPKNINLITNKSEILIDTIENLIASKISTTYNKDVKKIKHDLTTNVIATDQEVRIKIDPVKMMVSLTFMTKGRIAKVDSSQYNFQVLRDVIIPTKTLYPYSDNININKNAKIEKRYIWSDKVDQLVSKNAKLGGYRLRNIAQEGKAITINDITPKNVVHSGKIVPIIHEVNGLLIRTNGVSRSSGKIGDVIEVKLKNSKIVNGTIKLDDDVYVKI